VPAHDRGPALSNLVFPCIDHTEIASRIKHRVGLAREISTGAWDAYWRKRRTIRGMPELSFQSGAA